MLITWVMEFLVFISFDFSTQLFFFWVNPYSDKFTCWYEAPNGALRKYLDGVAEADNVEECVKDTHLDVLPSLLLMLIGISTPKSPER